MSELIEILLEDITSANLPEIVDGFVSNSLGSIATDQNDNEVLLNTTQNLMELIPKIKAGYPLLIRLERIKINTVEINNVLLRIYFSDNQFDLEASFVEDDVRSTGDPCVDKLQEYFITLKTKHAIKNVICGYEPALDEDTRFFTNNSLGPIKNLA